MGDRPSFEPFDVYVPATEQAVRAGLKQVLAHLAPLALTTDDAGTVELVLAEALNNIVEHAFDSFVEAGNIHIHCCQNEMGLDLAIIDGGAAMPDGKAPDARIPDVAVDVLNLPEGGFGWFMIHTLAQHIRYERIGARNHLHIRLSVGE